MGGGMSRVARSFICGGCLGSVTGASRAGVDVGASAELELVDGFCCLGGMLGVGGDSVIFVMELILVIVLVSFQTHNFYII